MKKTLHHIISSLCIRHLLLCLVSLNILIASTGFTYTTVDNIDTPKTEVLILDFDLKESFDLKQVPKSYFLPIPINRFFVRDCQLAVHEAKYNSLWNQVNKECLIFDIPVFFPNSPLYSTENPPLPTSFLS